MAPVNAEGASHGAVSVDHVQGIRHRVPRVADADSAGAGAGLDRRAQRHARPGGRDDRAALGRAAARRRPVALRSAARARQHRQGSRRARRWPRCRAAGPPEDPGRAGARDAPLRHLRNAGLHQRAEDHRRVPRRRFRAIARRRFVAVGPGRTAYSGHRCARHSSGIAARVRRRRAASRPVERRDRTPRRDRGSGKHRAQARRQVRLRTEP